MTANGWRQQVDSLDMLYGLEPWLADGRVSHRQLRLYACACARRLWDRLSNEARGLVELAERYVDGDATDEELVERGRAYDAGPTRDEPAVARACIAFGSGYGGPEDYQFVLGEALDDGLAEENTARRMLLRDVLDNAIDPTPFDAAWRTDRVVGIATTIHCDRDFSAMPVLGDALEEAGCDNSVFLDHCRAPRTHVRGCWVVDLLLGRCLQEYDARIASFEKEWRARDVEDEAEREQVRRRLLALWNDADGRLAPEDRTGFATSIVAQLQIHGGCQPDLSPLRAHVPDDLVEEHRAYLEAIRERYFH